MSNGLLVPHQIRSHNRKTKIVATIGPASRSPEMLKSLIQAGVNVFRLNFSHGTHDEHLEVLQSIRRVSDELGMHVAVLQDLSGPKIRITNVDGDYETILDEASIELRATKDKGSLSNASVIYSELIDPVKILKAGHRVLLADGIIELQAEEIGTEAVRCTVVKGGRIRSRVGIAFPDSHVDLPAATDKDLKDLEWGIKHGVDYHAISFVQTAQDVLMLRDFAKKFDKQLRIVAKIERKVALENIQEILDVSDGLMVARGDLGMELPLEQLPLVQKRLIEEANFRGIPVIVATQMLHSMITSVRPTRAEVSDIAAAVMSGADAVMLSEETAIGEHPVAAVTYLAKIALEAEQTFAFEEYKLRLRDSDSDTVPDAVAYAACAAAVKVKAAAVIACTETGTSARLIAKYRPQQTLFGASSNKATLSRMCLFWGVIPVLFEEPDDHPAELVTAIEAVQKKMNIKKGSRAVITGGISVRTPGSTSVLEIKEFV